MWIHGEGVSEAELLLPSTSVTDDYATRISQALKVLERVEGRSQMDILNDINLAGVDVIRIRAPEANTKLASTHFRSSAGIVSLGLEMMEAAASATLVPKKVLPSRRASEVDEYLKWLELGQSERGSYVITILSRVEPMLAEDKIKNYNLFEPPFPRRVTRTLSKALDATKGAATISKSSGGFQSFIDSVREGVSANLCEAIGGMLIQSEHLDHIDLGISWAPKLPEKEQSTLFTFERFEAETLFEGAAALRRESPNEGILLTGVVIKLHREPGAVDGEASDLPPVVVPISELDLTLQGLAS